MSEQGALRLDHPWQEASLAELYDAFPFTADVPLYESLARREGGNVLELGCGTGRVLLPLVRAGHHVTGVDASPHMLALARQKLAAESDDVRGRARLVEGDMRQLDLGARFDVCVVAVKSFAYLLGRDEQLQALEHVASHLRPGGLLALDLLNPTREWLDVPDGYVRQDLTETTADGTVISRSETMVRTDFASQVRTIRSVYDIVAPDGTVTKRLVEWPYRWTYRFEAEHLLERAGLAVENVHGGYAGEPFVSSSPTMLMLARR